MVSKLKEESNSEMGGELFVEVGQYDGWEDAELDLYRSRRRLLKLFRSKKIAQPSREFGSPLGWFVDQVICETALTKVDNWSRLQSGDVNPRLLAAELFEIGSDLIGRFGSASKLDSGVTVGESVTLLGISQALSCMVGHCELSDWTQLVSGLVEISQKADLNQCLAPPVYQMLAVELPLTICFQLPEIEGQEQLARSICSKISASLTEQLDIDGWPQATYLEDFGLLAASWVRCGLMLRKMKLALNEDAFAQLEGAVSQVLRLLRPNGTLAFSSGDPRPADASLIYSLRKLSKDPKIKKVLKRIGEQNLVPAKKKQLPPSCLSEWGASATLRSHWGEASPRVCLDFSSTEGFRGEIARSKQLIAGDIMPEISINGVSASPIGDFQLVCEESDRDVEYAELELKLTGDTTLSRQVLLSRDEEFLIIADSIVPGMAARIDYRCRYPLADGILGMRESENREVYLRTSEIQALVLPLALPEWKVGITDDRLEFKDHALELVQSIDGFGLCAPLFFDLNPKRSRLKRTWRQLTVAEDLLPVPRDVAVAYRVQIDEQQWFLYRALTHRGNRTFFGENFTGEFMLSRFEKGGKVSSLIVVE